MRAVAAAWGILAAGVSGQVAVELLTDDGIAARATALGLTAVLLGMNRTGRLYPHWIPFALCISGFPLWVNHGAEALSRYDPEATAASALSPILLIVGTFLIYAERHDRFARGET